MSEERESVLRGAPGTIALGYHQSSVITLGRHTPEGQILSPERAQASQVEIFPIDRGGGATIHGPGQIVIYPVVNARSLKLSVKGVTEALEHVVVDLAAAYGAVATGIPGRPGVYVQGKKLGAIGFHMRRGVMTHGLAININNDLDVFSLISPCGVLGQQVTSLQAITGKPVDEAFLARQTWRFVCQHLGVSHSELLL
tara:strand:- start:631 stop:1224 length:594 start_codon:yes stop_codon:yes gene_type:complete